VPGFRIGAIRDRANEGAELSSVASWRPRSSPDATGPRRRAVAVRLPSGLAIAPEKVDLVVDDRGESADRRPAAPSGCVRNARSASTATRVRRSSMAAARASIRASSQRIWIAIAP